MKINKHDSQQNIPIIEKLLSKIEKDKKTKCWNYCGNHTVRGYGVFKKNKKAVYVHRYFYWYFKLKPKSKKLNKKLVICHKCDNISCCNPKHLFLGTQKDNIHDCISKNRNSPPPVHFGELNSSAVLTEKQVLKIVKSSKSNKFLALKYGVSATTISEIKKGKSWGWLTGIKYKRKNRKILKDDDVIISIFNSKGKYATIALQYDVSIATVCAIKTGKTYSNITGKVYRVCRRK